MNKLDRQNLATIQAKPTHSLAVRWTDLMPLDPNHVVAFRQDLTVLSSEELFQKYIAPDACAAIEQEDQVALRHRIANKFQLQPDQVMIVGSAKLGFTLRKKEKNSILRPKFSPFDDSSDVDVAIISSTLFDTIWKQCFDFWHSSGYASAGYWPQGDDFRNYIFRGWMRPDMLPSEGSFEYRREWFDFFRVLTNEGVAGDFKITAGLYREQYFLEKYQHISLDHCRREVGN